MRPENHPGAFVAAFLAVIIGGAIGAVLTDPASPHADRPAAVIHEDDPRWDCRTMGNRQCGGQK